MKFQKWEGLGNDFIVVTSAPSNDQVRRWCDRRRGIGGDGVLVVTPAGDGGVRMVVLNADGSRPEMCGNGLRCVVGHVARARGLKSGALTVETDVGGLRCSFVDRRDRFDVTASMGATAVIGHISHGERRFLHIDVGNPHAVTFDDFEDAALDRIGVALQTRIEGGINVEMCQPVDDAIQMVVWERGVGRTQACGTGACAVAVAAIEGGIAATCQPIEVRLPGGSLTITIADDGMATMEGPARLVFEGHLPG